MTINRTVASLHENLPRSSNMAHVWLVSLAVQAFSPGLIGPRSCASPATGRSRGQAKLFNMALWPLDGGASPRVATTSLVRVRSEPWDNAPGDGIKCAYLKAEHGRGVEVGGCGVELTRMTHDGLVCEDDPMQQRAVLSGTLFVNPSFRRQGVAQRLLREAEGKARSWGCTELLLIVKRSNANALGLYEKLGYKAKPHTPHHGPEICLVRNLFFPDMHTLASVMPQVTKVSL